MPIKALEITTGKTSGRELELMISGKKPLAVFYRAVEEYYDETGGQDFSEYVRRGEVLRSRFYIKNEGQNFKIMYVIYYRPREEWRAEMYKCIKKIGQTIWNAELERIEGILLGY